MSKEKLIIFDTTMRDGEQSPGASMTKDEKLRIARQLERMHVDIIEAGFPAASDGDFESVKVVAAAVRESSVCGLARANEKDVRRCGEAVTGAKWPRVHTFIATSPIHMEKKLRLEPAQVLEQASSAVEYAHSRADEVEFSCEDATRSDPAFVAQVSRAAIAAGASVINLPDTVGYMLPSEYTAFLNEVRRLCPELRGVVLSAHCHDDLGLAVSNSLAAVEAGVGQVECTVNGIGERAGNASLEEIVMALRVRRDYFGVETGIDPSEIAATSRLVELATGYDIPPNKAIVGANAFAHEAGIHQDGLLKDVSTYQIMEPTDLGFSMTLPLGKHSGRHAFALACLKAGFPLEGTELSEAFARFKAVADSGHPASIHDALAAEVTVP